MKIAVFGGTGGVGQSIVQQALDAGHSVNVLARTPEKMTLKHDELHVLAGNGFDLASVSQTISEQDAVLCTIGGLGLGDSTTRTKVTHNILAAMKEHGVSRLVVCSSLGAGNSGSHLSFVGKMVVNTLLRNAIRDHTEQEALVQASDLNWSIVRPPRLTDEAKTEQYRLAEEGDSFTGAQISRADVAHFMIRILEEDAWSRKAVSISL